MGNFGEQSCALCLSVLRDGNFEEIHGVTKDILEVILPKLNFDSGTKQVICNVCSLEVLEAFKFKSTCLYTHNIIISYMDDGTGCSVDLREIYAKEKGIEQLIDTSDEHKVCRFCMRLISTEFISVQEANMDMIKTFIPEINFSVIKDPVTCRQCFDSFDVHSSFVRRCLEVEKGIEGIYRMVPSAQRSLVSRIKTEIEIKSEAIEHEEELSEAESARAKPGDKDMRIKTEAIEIKMEENDDESDRSDSELKHISQLEETKSSSMSHILKRKKAAAKEVHRCEKCDYKTVFRNHFANHQLVHEDPSKIKEHKCDICGYAAKKRCYLLRHLLSHKSPCEVDMFKCIYCDYESKTKPYIRRHYIIHHGGNLLDPEENSKITQMLNLKYPLPVQVLKCGRCPYSTLSEVNFLDHQCKPVEKLYLKCDHCCYTTTSKNCLRAHQIVHKNPSNKYKCHNCNYETRYKNHITRHLLKHKNPEQVQMRKCMYCSFESKYKEGLMSHLLNIHTDILYDPKENLRVQRMLNLKKPFSLEIYKCDKCIYETVNRCTFNAHLLTHKDPSHARMYKCDVCDFETKNKKSLRNHKLNHAKGLNFKCDTCGYTTRQKNQLNRHKLTHKSTSEIKMYKCHTCDYETKHKGSLVHHQLVHKSPSQLRMYKCDACNFKTKYKNSIDKHKLTHKDPSQVRLYRCDACGYTAKQKNNLTRHQLNHKNSSEMRMYTCDCCDYESRHRNNLKKHRLQHERSSEVQGNEILQ
ncbi:zinc finger protein 729-like [Anoplophora glabripennis]|uniref:zinc finger protein 729-like n=1 Tax=Anoplophora glabripennis TaxID=217634 RepID=UPI0008752862|nr:zinc finger protein 729-like [Anoplophora glabripennis]